MPKPQKYRDVARFLRSRGWSIQRRPRGSHEVWGDGTGPCVSIAKHADVSPGQLRLVIRHFPDEYPKHWKEEIP